MDPKKAKPSLTSCRLYYNWIFGSHKCGRYSNWYFTNTIATATKKLHPYQIPPGFPIVIWFENKLKLIQTSQKIQKLQQLPLIEGPNEKHLVEYWNVLNRDSKGNILEITFAIDSNSASKLKAYDFYIAYGYGTVYISSAERQNPGEKNNESKKVNVTMIERMAATSKKDTLYSSLSAANAFSSIATISPDPSIEDITSSTYQLAQKN
ncbi:hypothetical protein FF38_05348 [Lucilia cuprina]|uniref:DUF4780 domain-containing protein n=1 Tax=Lucilia cuprina TaxID=7375 RepID=A0A0L0BNL5_LUCCU|nr:hypothetical protein FF38_05348 [Lucilia cuprina]